jgi:hypothetical protein
VAIAPELDSFNNECVVGKAAFHDNSAAATSSAFTVMYSTPGNALFLRLPTNDVWSDVNPVVPAQQDRITGYFMYPTSVP